MKMLEFVREPVANARTSDLVNPAKWLVDIFGGRKTASGQPVTPTLSMTLSAYFACIRAVAEDLGKLPWSVRKVDGERTDEVRTSPVWPLLQHWANPEMGSQQFREIMLTWAMGWGNGYAEIERDADGLPIALWPIHPSLIHPWRDPVTWKLWYRAVPFQGFPGGLLEPRNVFHLHGIGPDGIQGWSIAELARQDIGNALAGQEFEGRIYASGATNRGVLKYPKVLKKEDISKLRRQWLETYGSGREAGAPIILEGGMEFVSVSYNPRDAMFLESMKEGVVTIARWFRIPPHKLGSLEKATLNNVEHLGIEYVTDTVLSWATRLEGEAARKLFSAQELVDGMTSHIDLDALLRGDFKTRSDGTRTLISTAVMSPNDGRRLYGLNPSVQDGADSLWLQGAMRRIDQPAPVPGAPGGDAPVPPEDAPDDPNADPMDPERDDNGPPNGGDPAGAPISDPTTPATPARAPKVAPQSAQQLARAAHARRAEERRLAGAKAAAATHEVFLDAGARIARRHEKVFARLALKHHSDGTAFQAEVASFLAGERPTLLEVLQPAARTLLATAIALDAPGVDLIGGRAVLEAFVERYLTIAAEGAWSRYRQGQAYDIEREGSQIALGVLHQFDLTLAAA